MMNKDFARKFWQCYLGLVIRGAPNQELRNPVIDFMSDNKAGKYDHVNDEDWHDMLDDMEQLAKGIWNEEKELTAGDLLIRALGKTKISRSFEDQIVDLLAQSSTLTDYPREKTQDKPDTDYWDFDLDEYDESDIPEDWSPRAVYDYLSERIHGQDDAKKAASLILYNHTMGRRTNAVFCGPSGCGKTEMWRYLQKDFPKLIRIIDASRLAADGWKGSVHVRDIFEGLSPEDLRLRGLIVVLDEADKICCEAAKGAGGTDYNRLAQNSLLKMLDGDVIEFGAEDKFRPAFSVDCSNVSVVLLGAFENLLKNKSVTKSGIGFGSETKTTCDYSNTDISYADLIKSGMRQEIAGRINRIVSLRPLSVEDYVSILTGPVLDDITGNGSFTVEIDDNSVRNLAEKAVEQNLGVRWMRSQLLNKIDDMVFDDPEAEVYTVSIS